MEAVTNIAYRNICKKMGADIVYTEFVNSEGLIRGYGKKKMIFHESERPIGIQIYGNDTDNMVSSAILAEELQPDFIDINSGCWVKKVAHRGAGAGLLKDPVFMQSLIKKVIQAVKLPITVKTRIGWDNDSINILEIAKRLEEVGVAALTVHCRTRSQGHSGQADWNWINKIKQKTTIPIILNGSILTAFDALKAFTETKADGIMIARGAIGNPWIFREIKEILTHGKIITLPTLSDRIQICLEHLRNLIGYQEEKIAILSFRKYYSGYLKGFPQIVKLREKIMRQQNYQMIENLLYNYLEQYSSSLVTSHF
jgi:tRNA-dihydrouridine synthase B